MHYIILLSLAFLAYLTFGFFAAVITAIIIVIAFLLSLTGLYGKYERFKRELDFRLVLGIAKRIQSKIHSGTTSDNKLNKALIQIYMMNSCTALINYPYKGGEEYWKHAQEEDQSYFNMNRAKEMLIERKAWEPAFEKVWLGRQDS